MFRDVELDTYPDILKNRDNVIEMMLNYHELNPNIAKIKNTKQFETLIKRSDVTKLIVDEPLLIDSVPIVIPEYGVRIAARVYLGEGVSLRDTVIVADSY